MLLQFMIHVYMIEMRYIPLRFYVTYFKKGNLKNTAGLIDDTTF